MAGRGSEEDNFWGSAGVEANSARILPPRFDIPPPVNPPLPNKSSHDDIDY